MKKNLERATDNSYLEEIIIDNKLLSKRQLQRAFDYQRKYGGELQNVLVSLNLLTNETVTELMGKQNKKCILGELLIQNGEITHEQLKQAFDLQNKKGGSISDILLDFKIIDPKKLYKIILNNRNKRGISTELPIESINKLPEMMANTYNAVILKKLKNKYIIAVSSFLHGEPLLELVSLLKMPFEQILVSHEEMDYLFGIAYKTEMVEKSINKLRENNPENSAHTTIVKRQWLGFAVIGIILLLCLMWNWLITLIVVSVLVQIFYFIMTFCKFQFLIRGLKTSSQLNITKEEIKAINDHDLPIYSILVPIYKESKIIIKLLNNIDQLDYPKEKLDVRLLLEEDDIETKKLLDSIKIPDFYTVIVVPNSMPKTKPKACNYGLIRARGTYVVIYDAEDQPDPDQLKKVYLAFRKSPSDCCCIQAKLNYFNSKQNILTRLFTQEYSMWFELILPGIMQMGTPIPLGGTSNHFKLEALSKINAWDPYNVTEDADLGIRLYKEGYTTRLIDSYTWEEANSQVGNWIRQRSRWIKGYMQTWLVHMRHPIQLWRKLGTKGFLGFQVIIFSTPIIPLINPWLWLILCLWHFGNIGLIKTFFPGAIYYLAAIELLLGNFMFIYSNTVGNYWILQKTSAERRYPLSYSLIKYSLLMPLYWIIMSLAAYKALWQLIVKPSYWEKTKHGLNIIDIDASVDRKGGILEVFEVKNRMVIYLIFLTVFLVEFSLGYYMGVVRGFIPDDSMSRIANAYYVLFSRDPHLGAVGFIWNPLPSLIEMVILLFTSVFPGLAKDGLVGIIATSFFTASTIVLMYISSTRFCMPKFLAILIGLVYLIHPMTLLYGSNGMSEAIFVFWIMYIVIKLTMWIEEHETNALVKAAIALSLAFYTRYESVMFFVAVCISVAIIIMYSQSYRYRIGQKNNLINRLSEVEGTLILLSLPFVYSVLAWLYFNYVIMDDAFHFLNSVYSNVSQSEEVMRYLTELVNRPLDTFIFIVERSIYFCIPLGMILLIRLIEGRLFRQDFIILLILIISIPALQYIMLLKGTSYGWLRFFMYPLPIVVAWIPYEFRKLKFRKLGMSLIVSGILVSGMFVGKMMHDPIAAPEEYDAIYRDTSYKFMKQKSEMAEYLSIYYPKSRVLLDTFTLSSFMLKVENPKRLYITSDYDFNAVLNTPWNYEIDFIIAPNPNGIGKFDAINRKYPNLFSRGAEWCSLERDFGQWRLYKIEKRKVGEDAT
ncbi:hypothetical protein COD21_30460 [Bacillus cereus]|uniref:glycosyltransferase family 2 protein n=1 Tax=Bacillus cereus TaxID=1396 RepID=UPI000BFDB892|nr:glycosyltransferase family 2 protein [Bacillus cereus]PGU00840.1 hypothetical protein COD21_30460 [Bacillus cereus]